ncbi:MAG: DASS family sodium-coupled anion symporter [Halanaerobiales bacterium]|nr:DASS family sodium-coupled anion symporter [Halanaerobiales bacterium]
MKDYGFKKYIIFGGIILFVLIIIMPTPENLSLEGKRALAIFILCLSLWVTNYLPLAITSILGIALIPLLNVFTAVETFAIFGNRAVFFILGALIIAAAIYKTGIAKRISYFFISKIKNTFENIILSIIISSYLFSLIMPEHAVAAILFPIVFELIKSLNLKPLESNFAKASFLALAWGAVIGGITTYLGGARNILAVGLLENNYGISISFLDWMKYSIIYSLPLLIISYFIIIYFFKSDLDNLEKKLENIGEKYSDFGMISKDEKKLSYIFSLIIISWMFLSSYVDISVTAILGGVLIFVFKIVNWEDIESYISWGIILMYGGAIVIATALTRTGAAEWLSNYIFKFIPHSTLLILIVIIIITKFLTEGVSNVAAVAIVLPIAFSMGNVLELNPIIITYLVALTGGLAFCLPMGAPPNAIAFSSGYLELDEVIKVGLILNLISIILLYIIASRIWPLLGLNLFL